MVHHLAPSPYRLSSISPNPNPFPFVLQPPPTHRHPPPLPEYPKILYMRAVSDAVMGNLTTIYVAVIAGVKAYGIIVCGRNYGVGFLLVVSTAIVCLIMVGALTWDVSRKATYAISRERSGGGGGPLAGHEICKGGICWHGVAVRSPASQVRFRLPHHHHQ